MRTATRMVVFGKKNTIDDLLSKLLVYFDASQNLTLATSTNVSQWVDRVSGLVASQGTASAQPLVSFSNGQTYLDFADNDSRFLTVNTPLSISTLSKIYFCFSNTIIAGTINASTISSFEIGRYGSLFNAIILFNGIPSPQEDSRILEFLKTRFAYNSQSVENAFAAPTPQAGNLLTKRVSAISDVIIPGITLFRQVFRGCTALTSFPLIDISSVTNIQSSWYDCSGLTSFPLLDTSKVITLSFAWRGCSSLTSFPLINTSNCTSFNQGWAFSGLTSFPLLNVSKGTIFQYAWVNCTALTSFPANFFNNWTATPALNCFDGTWQNCTALTAQSVENILVSIAASGRSAPAGATGLQADISVSYNTSTGSLSTATTNAITTLKSRGWKPRINGNYQ